MYRASRILALLALVLTASACGSNSDGGSADGAPVAADAAIPVDAARIDGSPAVVVDAAPRPDAIPGFACGAPIHLASGDSFLGDTSNYNDTSSASCSAGSQTARDTIFQVTLPNEPTDLIARVTVDDDVTPTFDAVVSIQTSCGDESSEVACSDFGFSEATEALALSGEAYISVDGTAQFGGSPDGTYQLDVRTRSIASELGACDPLGVASRCETGLLCVAGQCQEESPSLACSLATAITSGSEVTVDTHAYQTDFSQGSCAFKTNANAGEALFAFTLAQPSSIVATTDFAETSFDTVLYLQSECEGAELACADDIDAANSNFRSRLQVANLPAGDYILVVDGASSAAPNGRVRLRFDATLLP